VIDHSAILATASEGGSREPPLVVVWGPGGIGKTSFALKHAEKAAVVAFEVGARTIANTKVFPTKGVVQSWEEGVAIIAALADGHHDYRTVVIDSFNPLESLLISHIVKQSGKGSYEKMGWGREVPPVAELRTMLGALERMKYRGIQVVIIAHEKRATQKNPVGDDYGMFTASTQIKETWQALFEWADIVGFCRDDFHAFKGKQVQASGARTLHTIKGPGYQAKQRYGYELASPIALDWRAFREALAAGGDTAEQVITRIGTIVDELNDPDVTKKAESYIKEAGRDLHQLREIENALLTKKEQKQ
jgi:hypothetical protein